MRYLFAPLVLALVQAHTLPPVRVEATDPRVVHAINEVLPESLIVALQDACEAELVLLRPSLASNYRSLGDSSAVPNFHGFYAWHTGVRVSADECSALRAILLDARNYTHSKRDCAINGRAGVRLALPRQAVDVLIPPSCSSITWWINGKFGHANLQNGFDDLCRWFEAICPDSLEDLEELEEGSSNKPLQPPPAPGE